MRYLWIFDIFFFTTYHMWVYAIMILSHIMDGYTKLTGLSFWEQLIDASME